MTLIKEVDGINVYVNSDGRFIAEVNGKVINKPSLREVERELAKIARGLAVFSFDGYALRQYIFISCESKGSYSHAYRDKDNCRHPSHHTYYKSTPELLEQLADLEKRWQEAEKAFEAERVAILENAEHVSRDDFKTNKSESK